MDIKVFEKLWAMILEFLVQFHKNEILLFGSFCLSDCQFDREIENLNFI